MSVIIILEVIKSRVNKMPNSVQFGIHKWIDGGGNRVALIRIIYGE